MKKIIYIVSSGFLLCSCASIFSGSRKSIIIDSNVKEKSTLTIDGNKHKDISFPYSVKVKRGFNSSVVKGEIDGYEPAMLHIEKTFNPVSIINLGSILGWGIDAATGAMMKPEYNNYDLEFGPIKKQEKKD